MTDPAVACCSNPLLVSPLEVTSITGCRSCRDPKPPSPGWVSRGRRPVQNGEWLADGLCQGRRPRLYATARLARDCPVTRALLRTVAVRRGTGAIKRCKIERAISCRRVFIRGAEASESRRTAGRRRRAAWTQPPLLCAAPMTHCHPSRRILPRNVSERRHNLNSLWNKKKRKKLKPTLVRLLQNGAEACSAFLSAIREDFYTLLGICIYTHTHKQIKLRGLTLWFVICLLCAQCRPLEDYLVACKGCNGTQLSNLLN